MLRYCARSSDLRHAAAQDGIAERALKSTSIPRRHAHEEKDKADGAGANKSPVHLTVDELIDQVFKTAAACGAVDVQKYQAQIEAKLRSRFEHTLHSFQNASYAAGYDARLS